MLSLIDIVFLFVK